jgi:hypothetical protein
MIRNSKFNYKQRIYWLESNKVRSAIVKSIDFGRYSRINGKDHWTDIVYFVSNTVKSSVINWNGGGLRESECFSTKKELLNSL